MRKKKEMAAFSVDSESTHQETTSADLRRKLRETGRCSSPPRPVLAGGDTDTEGGDTDTEAVAAAHIVVSSRPAVPGIYVADAASAERKKRKVVFEGVPWRRVAVK